uniref:TAFH domain-containing protein n=1 Tax=Parascaris univalens TaxID=6257 RepID=A0A915ACH6_PARUN
FRCVLICCEDRFVLFHALNSRGFCIFLHSRYYSISAFEMGDGVQQSSGTPSGNGPRFRIVPGPMLGENSRSNVSRPALAVPMQSQPFGNQQSVRQEELNQGVTQHMVVGGAHIRQPVQCMMMNQGVSMGDMSGSTGAVSGAGPSAQCQQRPPSAAEQANMVSKCARFFKTLIHLSQQPDRSKGQQTAVRVTELVKQVIYGIMPPEAFTGRLQMALRSQAQPHLLPFLQKTLPALRAAMQKGEVVIDGIEPPQAQPPVEMQHSPQWDATQHRTTNEPIAYMPQMKVEGDESSQADASETMTSDSDVRTLSSSYVPYRVLNVDVLARKIQRAMPDGGQPAEDVLTMISQAAENRLCVVLARLSVIAEHRLEQLRNHPMYQVVDDTRRQLRFLEELDRREHERRENREKEALIRLSKSKSKDKDTLVEKAKQLQRADQEAARNRDANAAAIAALGGVKSQKRSWADANNPFEQPVSMGLSAPMHRPRTKRVTMRDLQFVLAEDPLTQSSKLRLRLSLFNTPMEVHPA